MNLELDGKRALVLASSSGLGLAVATELGREGAMVCLNSRSDDRAQAAATTVRNSTGAETFGLAGDVSDADDGPTLISRAAELMGGLDILVCNAGGPPAGNFGALDDDKWAAAFELTLMSVVRSIRQAIPLLADGGGSIVVMGSSSVRQPIPGLLLSNAFRPAVYGVVKHLASELAGQGIRVNMLSPGRVQTERIDQLDNAKAEREGIPLEQVKEQSINAIPMGRLGEPAEFGRVAAFLASSAASYVTGSSWLVDGGMVKSL